LPYEKYIRDRDRGPGAWPVVNSHLPEGCRITRLRWYLSIDCSHWHSGTWSRSNAANRTANFEPDQRALFPELSICSSVEVDVTQRLSALTIPGR